jgi:hypothetical protein
MEIEFEQISRLEIIDEKGRQYARWTCHVEPSVQDNGKTLKLFVREPRISPDGEKTLDNFMEG